MAFTLSYKQVINQVQKFKRIKELLEIVYKDFPNQNCFFGDDKKIPTANRLYMIKTSEDNVKFLSKKFRTLLDKSSNPYQSNLVKFIGEPNIRFQVSKKTIAVSAQDALTTATQERSSLKFFEAAFTNKNQPTITDIQKIYPKVDESWYQSFIDQTEALLEWRKSSKFNSNDEFIFNRDEGFMEFISKKVALLGVRSKDAWNPADVWIIKKNKEKEILRTIEKIDKICQLNAYMFELLMEGSCLGISLKKTGKRKVKVEEVNCEKKVNKTERILYQVDDFNVLFTKKSNGAFFHAGATVNIQEKTIKGSIRQFPVKFGAKSNVQFELIEKGAAARLGKIPKKPSLVALKKYGINEIPTWKSTPLSLDEYIESRSSILLMIDCCFSSDLNINFGISNRDDVVQIVDTEYKVNQSGEIVSRLSSKIQGLEWAYIFAKLNKEKRNKLMTDFVYLAKKENQNCGPFIKIS